jgi:hypothetical protein
MDTRRSMSISSVKRDIGMITVRTTGAMYIFESIGKKGRIECRQMLNKQRLLAVIELDHDISDMCVEKEDASVCIISIIPAEANCGYIRIQINRDSMMEIYSCFGSDIKADIDMSTEYFAENGGHMLFVDNAGGIGLYPYKGYISMETERTNGGHQIAGYRMSADFTFLVSVFPPREFNMEQYYDDNIFLAAWSDISCNHAISPYPSDSEIEYVSRYVNIVHMTDTVWKGKLDQKDARVYTRKEVYANAACSCYDYEPADNAEFLRVIKKAHSLGMKVITYMSPYYSMAKGDDFFKKMKDVIERYEVDGIYFDGVSADIMRSYDIVTKARAILGDKILYIHCTSDPISRKLYCPFIDTYADYILRAEHIRSFDDGYLRYVVSGYNISNSIGFIAYWGYPAGFIKKLNDIVFDVKAKFYLGAVGENRGEAEEIIENEYFPKLKTEGKKWIIKNSTQEQV